MTDFAVHSVTEFVVEPLIQSVIPSVTGAQTDLLIGLSGIDSDSEFLTQFATVRQIDSVLDLVTESVIDSVIESAI